jgi:hypothetical protein
MSTPPTAYPFDPTGAANTNLVTGERQILTPPNWGQFYFILPLATPFFANSNFQAVLQPSGKVLQEGVDFVYCYRFYDATVQCAYPVYGGLYFMDMTLSGVIELQYQTLGGDWTLDSAEIATVLANQLLNPIITTWEEVVNVPYQFPPIAHQWDIIDMVGASDIVNVLNQMVTALQSTNNSALAAHLADFNNPHRVTAAQVGLGNVVNYGVAVAADAVSGSSATLYMTPSTTLVEINTFAVAPLNAHIANQGNPHNTTAAQVGLGLVNNFGWATTAVAQAGTSVTAYMNPALTAAAITTQAIAPLNTHIANLNNPHDVTATQVGLSNVPNFPQATLNQAQTGTDNASLMTPYLVSQLLGGSGSNGIAGQLEAHIDNFSNPHQVTATQVGLGSVQNYGIATDADAIAGVSTSLYMTPETTFAVITNQLTPYAAHLINYENPHQVTAAQVGLDQVANYPPASIADAQSGVSTTEYMTPSTTAAAVSSQVGTAFNAHVADFSNPHEVTAEQVGAYPTAYIDGQFATLPTTYLGIGAEAANSTLFQGQTLSQVITTILGSLPPTARYYYPAIDPTTDLVDSGPTWTIIAQQPAYVPDTNQPLPPIGFFLSGGEGRSDTDTPLFMVEFDQRFPTNARVSQIGGSSVTDVTIGYVLDTDTGVVTLWVSSATLRNAVTLTVFSDPGNAFSTDVTIVDTEPTGIVYVTTLVNDPTVTPQKPNAGEVAFGQNFNVPYIASQYSNGVGNSTQFAMPVQFLSVALTSDDETAAAAIATPWISEWRNMGRISSFGPEAHFAGPLTTWSWDNTTSAINCNDELGGTLQTLLSSEVIPNGQQYAMEVELSSSDLADEAIGVCLGYFVVDGQSLGLWAMRTPGATVVDASLGNIPGSSGTVGFGLFTLGLNMFQSNGQIIASNTANLTWGDGTAGSVAGHETSYVPNKTTAGTNGWNNKGTVRIKFTFDGINGTVSTTEFNDTTGDYVTAANLTFSINDAPFNSGNGYGLASFYGGQRWGLSSYNQPNAEFVILSSPDFYGRYVYYNPQLDGTDDSTLYFYCGNPAVGSSGWVGTDLKSLTPGRLIYSDVNNTQWMTRRDNSLVPLPIVAYSGTPGTQILTT